MVEKKNSLDSINIRMGKFAVRKGSKIISFPIGLVRGNLVDAANTISQCRYLNAPG